MYTDSTGCGDTCDFYFKNFVIQDEEGNEFINVADTDDTGNTDTVYFSKVEQLDGVIPVIIHTGRSITISFEVWDKDTGNDDHERTISGLVVPFSGISKEASGSWSWKYFKSDTNAEGDDKKATLWIRYRIVSCNSNYAGLGCSIYCKPVSGYYRCGSSGEKVCEERRTVIIVIPASQASQERVVSLVLIITTLRAHVMCTVPLIQTNTPALTREVKSAW